MTISIDSSFWWGRRLGRVLVNVKNEIRLEQIKNFWFIFRNFSYFKLGNSVINNSRCCTVQHSSVMFPEFQTDTDRENSLSFYQVQEPRLSYYHLNILHSYPSVSPLSYNMTQITDR